MIAAPYYKPVLGEFVRASVGNNPTGLTAVTLGLDNQMAGGQPLPIDLAAFGMPGCQLYHSAEAIGPILTIVGGKRVFTALLPSQPSLLSRSIFVQAYAFAPGANPLQVITSNALEWVLGDV